MGGIGEHLRTALAGCGWAGNYIHEAIRRDQKLLHATVPEMRHALAGPGCPCGGSGGEEQLEDTFDQYLCQNGMVQSRERAKALIMSGIVFVNEQKADKAGDMISPGARVEIRGHDIGYVSRGGLKLEKAMQAFRSRRAARCAWTSAPPPAALPTACCKTAR